MFVLQVEHSKTIKATIAEEGFALLSEDQRRNFANFMYHSRKARGLIDNEELASKVLGLF
jgi:hypothetical protein